MDELFQHAVQRLEATRAVPTARCKICGGDASPFDLVDFNKSCEGSTYPLQLSGIPVMYRMCGFCHFIFTDFGDAFTTDQWRRYVYNEEYIKVDPEYLEIRPRGNARELITFLAGAKARVIGLDYGGGNGATSRLLRENGWQFDSFDPFGDTNMVPERRGRYNFCSAIEVFEHSPDPVESLRAIMELASPDRLIVWIATSVHDGTVSPRNRLSWWYAAPRNGHISLYSRRSLKLLGERFGLRYSYVRAPGGPHLLTRGISENKARALLVRGKLLRRARSALHLWPANLAASE